MLKPKDKFFFSKYGNMIKKDKESNVIHSILWENVAIRSVSFVSIYNHVIVNSDISGSDTIIDPRMILVFATSEAIKIIIADNIILIASNMIFCNLHKII